MSKRFNFLVILIFILAFALRLTAIYKYPLNGDYLIHWQEVAVQTGFILAGPAASMNVSFRQGPFYYHLLAFLQWLTNSNDRLVVVLFALLNSLTVFPLAALGKKFFELKTVAFILLIFSINQYLVAIGGSPWNPNLIPLLTTLAMYLAYLIRYENQHGYLPSLFVLSSWIIQCHVTAIPIVFFLLWWSWKKKQFHQTSKLYLIGVGLFGLSWLPYFSYQIQHQWQPLQVLLEVTAQSSESCDFVYWLKNHGQGETCFHYLRNTLFVIRGLAIQTFGARNMPLTLLSMVMLSCFAVITWKKQIFNLIMAPLVIIGCYLFYKSFVYIHYFNVTFPLGLLYLGCIADWASSKSKIFYWVTCGLVLIVNMFFLVRYLI